MRYVIVTEEKGAALFTINREEAMNALNPEVLAGLEHALDAVNLEKTRCIIITGAGKKAFAAGADIGSMQNFTQEEGKAFSQYGSHVFRKIETFPIPVIAAVNGYALGGGCELAMACDIRIASENAVLGQPETGIGVIPGFGGTQRLSRLIPIGKAKELLYTCSKIGAREALEVGLVNAVYPRENLLEQAMKLAHRIGQNAPIAVRAAKRAVNEVLEQEIEAALKMESNRFSECFETEDQVQGMTAFLEKRKVDGFKNR